MLQSEYLSGAQVSPVVSDSESILEFDRIGLEYPIEGGMRRIIEEISLSIKPGEFVSFVGPSGCEIGRAHV